MKKAGWLTDEAFDSFIKAIFTNLHGKICAICLDKRKTGVYNQIIIKKKAMKRRSTLWQDFQRGATGGNAPAAQRGSSLFGSAMNQLRGGMEHSVVCRGVCRR